jgi:replicative superfamily II helicase
MLKKIAYFLLAALVIIQFFRPVRNEASGPQANAIANKYTVPANVQDIMKRACNDCHSNNTIYPWYANVQPVAWWLADHVNEGKGELNFDEFLTYSQKKAHHKLEEVIEMVKEGEMPLKSYTIIHGNARLSQDEKVAITDWASATMKQIESVSPEVLEKK